MQLLRTLLAGLLLAPVVVEAQDPHPNTLSPAEVASGWILLFDGETTFGWAPRGQATWEVVDGTLTCSTNQGPGFLSTTTEFPNFVLTLEFWLDASANSGVFLRCPVAGEINAETAYEVNLADTHPQWPTGSIVGLARTDRKKPKTAGRWSTCEILADGDHLVVGINGRTVVDLHDKSHARGTIALQRADAPGAIRLRNLKLRPLGLTSIFNGEDLTGWKVVPGHKSVFSVTPQGWLNVKDGNGDLQSEGQYGDFVFQLDIISHGTHLNSGVFFRALPGQFWSGYESQIRNEWRNGDRSKPVDFGTGGIYNRQPARFVVSSDKAWFTKTIIAQGAHFATWVDGLQVTDWTDTRPPNDNARQGYRAQPGVLSLQGHDPTTNLSFRNLRIAEMPPATP